ncbi:MAG: PA2169 family four-helix-bundle protein [Alphaproteobacteria bacterium]|nr:PA2169 family four-helix-bundle protein [Alphaproteobacteria bacterium]
MTQPSVEQENKEFGKLININKDACEFYESACEKAESAQLKKTFRDLEDLHKKVAADLQRHVRAHGGDSKADETFVGQTQKFWGGLMASISNDVDETLVSHLEEAEDRCLKSMKDAINDDRVTPGAKTLLMQELALLQNSHDHMKSLKNYMKAA